MEEKIPYKNLLEPFSYGPITLKNRVIFAPTTMGIRGEEYFKRFEAIAKGGCAMIVIGDVPVLDGRFGPSLYKEKGKDHYRRLAEIAHKYDCKLCAQLHQNDTVMKGMFRYVPKLITGKLSREDVKRLMNEQTGDYISSLPKKEVQHITGSFGTAAVEALKAGFDMIQVHGDRMCGSFSSSVFNHRKDNYGGCIENRARFAVEAIKSIRDRLPDVAIDYKLAVRQESPHYGNAGVLEEELPIFVPFLEKAGVTSFHVTLANHSKLEDTIPPKNHPEFSEEGCFLKFCDQVKRLTKLPICGVGALSHPDFIENAIQEGRMDCAAMSRQLIADPDWVNKVQLGQEGDIHYCMRCNKKCLGGMYEHKGVHCIYEGRESS